MPGKQVPAEVSQLFQRIATEDSIKAANAARTKDIGEQSMGLSIRVKGIVDNYGKKIPKYVSVASGGGRIGMHLRQSSYLQTRWVEIPGEGKEASIIRGEGHIIEGGQAE